MNRIIAIITVSYCDNIFSVKLRHVTDTRVKHMLSLQRMVIYSQYIAFHAVVLDVNVLEGGVQVNRYSYNTDCCQAQRTGY